MIPCPCPRCNSDRSSARLRRDKPLIVGELNPFAGEDYLALFPHPRSSSGGRLCAFLGLEPATYLERFDRTNLCRGKWCQRAATDRAGELARQGDRRAFVLLGRRVAAAFGVEFRPFTVHVGPDALYAQLPHPSGKNRRIWGDPLSIELARRTVGALRG